MADILDEHLTREKNKQCKRLRNYTLLFSGLMACIALLLRLTGWTGERYVILTGMLAITFQAHYCFYRKQRKSWLDLTRVVLITLITGLAFVYYLLPEILYY